MALIPFDEEVIGFGEDEIQIRLVFDFGFIGSGIDATGDVNLFPFI